MTTVQQLVSELGVSIEDAKAILEWTESASSESRQNDPDDVPPEPPQSDSTQTIDEQLSALGLADKDAEDVLAWTDSAKPEPAADGGERPFEALDFLRASFPDIPEIALRAKLAESKDDLEKATDLLLNYDATKDVIDGQYFDRAAARQAWNRAKHNKKSARRRRSVNDITTLQNVLGLDAEAARKLYEQRGYSLSDAFAWYYRNDPAPRHVKHLVAEVVGANGPGQSGRGAGTADPPTSPGGLDIDSIFADKSLSQRNIAIVRQRYQARYEAQVARANRYQGAIPQHAARRYAAHEFSTAVADAQNTLAELEELDILAYKIAHYSPTSNVVDFHYMPVKAALAVAEDKIADWRRAGTPHLYLITGAGRHSEGGIARIKVAIKRLLQGEGIKFQEEEGAFLLTQNAGS